MTKGWSLCTGRGAHFKSVQGGQFDRHFHIYKKIKEKRPPINELKKLIRKYLPAEHFLHSDPYQIVFRCLELFNFRRLENEKGSITRYALIILSIYKYEGLEPDDIVRDFIYNFLGLEKLPFHYKLILEKEVKKDISLIDKLLENYEKDQFIKDHLKTGNSPRTHNQKTVLEFYKRTKKKKDDIVHYLLNGLDERAISKSEEKNSYTKKLEEADSYTGCFVRGEDFPYKDLIITNGKILRELDFEKLDYQKINPMNNKSFLFNFKSDTSQGYSKSIIQEIEKSKNPLKVLHEVKRKIINLPIINNRTVIINELYKLFKNKQWYGFYALALPQVEGIFSEMVSIVKPNKKSRWSLSEKVNTIREFYERSDYFFDYFEYYLPNQRNKFSHSGKDDDIKNKCIYLVLDLESIIEVFESLEAPLLKINEILKSGADYFSDIVKFGDFLNLIKKISDQKQLPLIEEKINNFIYKILLPKINLSELLLELDKDFKIEFSQFENTFIVWSKINHKKEVKLTKLSQMELLQNMTIIKSVIEAEKVFINRELQLLLAIDNFINYFPARFENILEKYENEFITFKKKFSLELKILKLIKSKIDIKFDFDHMITRQNLNHIVFLNKLKIKP